MLPLDMPLDLLIDQVLADADAGTLVDVFFLAKIEPFKHQRVVCFSSESGLPDPRRRNVAGHWFSSPEPSRFRRKILPVAMGSQRALRT